MINLEQVRKDSPSCLDKIFFNSAGSSLMPKGVVESIYEYLKEEERIGGYKLAAIKQTLIKEFYTHAAQLIQAKPHQMAFAGSSTDAYSKALSAIDFKPGDLILTTKDDYVSNQIAFISLQKRFQIQIVRVENLPDNQLDLEAFEKYIKSYQPKLVAVTHIPTSSGLIQNVEGVGELCKKYDVLYLVDACQSVGQIPVNVQKIHCDFLTATGRKFLRGPRGTGFLYVSDKILQSEMAPLFVDSMGSVWVDENRYELAADAIRFENFEYPVANIVGFNSALKYALQIGIQNMRDYSLPLADWFRQELNKISRIRTLDRGIELGNIITFSVDGISIDALESILDEQKIYYSITRKRSAIIDFTEKNVEWACRFSPHYFNTKEEMTKVLEILDQKFNK